MNRQQAGFVLVAGGIGFAVACGIDLPDGGASGSWLVGCLASFAFSTLIWD